MTRIKTKVDRLERDLESIRSRLDEVNTKLYNVNSQNEKLEGNVEIVKDYLKGLR